MHPGEIVGLLGPNGSGKSTLYSIIIGQHMADKGKIIIGNKDISEIPIHERTKLGLGYLSQQEVYLICRYMIIYWAFAN